MEKNKINNLDDNKELFETMPVSKAVWTLALPTILSMIVTVFYNLADTFFIGQTNDQAQVAAVSLVMPLFMLLMSAGNLFGIGGSSAISRFLGSNKLEDVKHVSSFCFYGSIFTGIVLASGILIFMPQIIPLTGATESTYRYVTDYLTVVAIGTPFIILSNAFGNIVRSIGSAKAAMIGMLIGTVTNIILDPIMILTLNMGVKGVALATVIGNIAATIYYVILLKKSKTPLSLSIKDFKIKDKIASNVLMIGVPASLNGVLMSASNVIYNILLVSYGDAPVAAMGISMKSTMMIVMLLLGLTMGGQPIIGYNYGSKNYDRMKKVIKYMMIVGCSIGLFFTIIFTTFTQQIIEAFINDAEVISYGVQMLKIQVMTGPFLGIIFVVMASLQSMGKALPSLLLSICRQGLVFVPVAFITNRIGGLDGLICAQPISDVFSIIISSSLLYSIIHKLMKEQDDKSTAKAS